MKITICGSIAFSNEMIDISNKLTQNGHDVTLPYTTDRIANGEISIEKIESMKEDGSIVDYVRNIDAIRLHYNEIKESDAILVVNAKKKGIENYIGANTFLEIGFAYTLNKKIFILNNLPGMNFHKEEIVTMQPIVCDGDLSKIT